MNKTKGIVTALLVLVAIAGSVAIAAEVIESAGPSGTWRYRITVSVDTPEGTKVGSAVREAHVELEPRPGYRPYPYHSVETSKGEAVVVDLGKRGVLFVLRKVDDERTLFEALPSGRGATTPPGIEYYNNLKNAKAIVNPKHYPRMVRFRDLADPNSVELVYRQKTINTQNQAHFDYEVTDNFEEIFGEGVRLKEITVETTDEPVTWSVEKWLPWLPEYYDKKLDGARHNYLGAADPVANSLSAGAFSTGRKE
jgi:hypothetical protein